MRAAVIEAFREPLVIQEVPDPAPAPHGAVIKVEANGICRSDWHGWVGDWPKLFSLPHVLGHEMCGIVEETGAEVSGFQKGDRVIVPFSGGDATCPMCYAGMAHLCQRPVMPGFRSWGGFAQYVSVDQADFNLVSLDEAIDFVAAAGMGCRFMTAFFGLVERAQVKPGEWVAVHGCGGVGLSAVQIATALGAQAIAVDIRQDKLDLAKSLGAVATVNAAEHNNPAKAVREITKGGAEVSVDALGIAATCRNGIKSLKTRGRHLQIGMTTGADKGELTLPIDLMVDKEITLVGSHGMPPAGYGPMLAMIAAGRMDPGKLVSNTVPLEEAGDVLAAMDGYDTLGITVIDRF